ncbi:MAG TPA: DUF2087 domain-containing protein [Ilumatobacteraceae bacterium]|nr:DUF2087 domain-containing protein [Ilumatobacteraceae bacterium]
MSEDATPVLALDAGRLAGLLADDDRRRVFAAVELGGTTLDAAATLARLPVPRAAKALSTLAGAGLVVQGDAGGLYVVGAAFKVAAREALSRQASDEHADRPDDVRRVFEAFVRDGRLTQIPTSRQKRLVVLDWLAQEFEPGTRYSETMVNLILGKRHPDTAALRRYLVDEGLLDRAGGEYWRTGGTVELDPS